MRGMPGQDQAEASMSRARYFRAYLSYKLGDWLEFKLGCPRAAGWVDWLIWRKWGRWFRK